MNKGSGPRSEDRGTRKQSRHAPAASASAGWWTGRRSREAPFLFQALGKKQQADYDCQHAQGNRRPQGPVVSSAEQADYDVRNHDAAGAAEQQGSEKISQA